MVDFWPFLKKVIARNGFSSDEESKTKEREEYEEEEESKMDDDELEVESDDEEKTDETEEVDDNDCNARLCSIGSIIKRKNANVAWVRCSACPKWFHQFCVDVSDDDLTFKCHNHWWFYDKVPLILDRGENNLKKKWQKFKPLKIFFRDLGDLFEIFGIHRIILEIEVSKNFDFLDI